MSRYARIARETNGRVAREAILAARQVLDHSATSVPSNREPREFGLQVCMAKTRSLAWSGTSGRYFRAASRANLLVHVRSSDSTAALWEALALYLSGRLEPSPRRFLVRYYDPKLSRKGQGVQARDFTTREEAERFAQGRRLYARPCRVETI